MSENSETTKLAQSEKLKKHKILLRRKMMLARKSMFESQPKAGLALAQNAVSWLHNQHFMLNAQSSIKKSIVFSAYHPFNSEIDCLPLIKSFQLLGLDGCLPVLIARGKELAFRKWNFGDELITGSFDIKIPPISSTLLVPDIVLVPLLAFDSAGYRLGYGGGFYDRTLAYLKKIKPITAIGIGFSQQKQIFIPHDCYDVALDGILTQDGFFSTTSGDNK